RYRFVQFGGECLRLMRENEPYIVIDSETDPRTSAVRDAYRATKIRSVICVPLHKGGRFVAAMAVHQTRPREWRKDEVDLVQTVASRCWESIERTRVTRELKEMDRRKDEFLAMLAHELRNPLAPIRTAAEVLRIKSPQASDLRMPTEIIARQVAHMTALVNDLLDVSRVTRGMVTLDKGEVDIREVVDSAVEQSRSLFETRRHNLALDLRQTHAVYGDRNRLVQIVTNLLNNAAKYTPEGGRIGVVLRQDGGVVEIAVHDNGIGIREEMISRVFDLFTQGDRSFDRAQGGLGLGLALVRRLVELHGGSVAAESPGPGKGSTFTVRLPRSAGESRSDPHPAPAPDPKLVLDLMVVDDNADAAISLATLLRMQGHAVWVEHEAGKALRRAMEKSRLDAIILDIGMPGMDGYELARQLRAQPKLAEVLLIALTGYGQAEDRDRARAAGFDHHVTKPADIGELTRILSSAKMPLNRNH
ncbi:MAG TPA: ATP-binding protein, partial [Burkholderiales bacterium]|nr:ATP-binding protein [Burkholderiales bacterium]